MTDKQKWFYFKLWRQACQAQGWKQSDTDKRHEITLEVLGYHKSSKFFTNQEFDRVKRHLQFLAKPNDLDAAIAADNPQDEERKRLLWKIQSLNFNSKYISEILFDRWGIRELERLNLDQLNELKLTLIQRARARDKQRKVYVLRPA